MTTSQWLFSFRGRLIRFGYWMAMLALVPMLFVAFLATLLAAFSSPSFGNGLAGLSLYLFVLLATHIPPLWIALAVGVKRLHDRNRSGWWLILFYVAPGVLYVTSETIGGFGIGLALAGVAIFVWALVELGLLRGTTGVNRYGPDPFALTG